MAPFAPVMNIFFPVMSSQILERMAGGELGDRLHLGLAEDGGFALRFVDSAGAARG